MSNSLLALVLLDTPATPDMSALAKALRARHPELAWPPTLRRTKVHNRLRQTRRSFAVATSLLPSCRCRRAFLTIPACGRAPPRHGRRRRRPRRDIEGI